MSISPLSRSAFYASYPISAPRPSPEAYGDLLLSKKNPQEVKALVESLRMEAPLAPLLTVWFRENHQQALAMAFPFITPEEKRALEILPDLEILVVRAWKALEESDLPNDLRFIKANYFFEMLTPHALHQLTHNVLLNIAAKAFLIAKLSEVEVASYLNIISLNRTHIDRFPLFNRALLWCTDDVHRLNRAKIMMASFTPLIKLRFLDKTARNFPENFIFFFCHLPPTQFDALQTQMGNRDIRQALAKGALTSAIGALRAVKLLKDSNLSSCLLQRLILVIRQNGYIETFAPLAAWPGLLKDSGDPTFRTVYDRSMPPVPPLLLAIGAQEEGLNEWLAKALPLWDERQLSHLYWMLPEEMKCRYFPLAQEHLLSSCLESVLNALPSRLLQETLDKKTQELKAPFRTAKKELAVLKPPYTEAMLDIASRWQRDLRTFLLHPAHTPYWRTSQELGAYMEKAQTIHATFLNIQLEITGSLKAAELHNPSGQELPLDYLEEELGHPDLAAAGIRNKEDLEALGLSCEQIRNFKAFEERLLADLPEKDAKRWHTIKWRHTTKTLREFADKRHVTPPSPLRNPLRRINAYLKQDKLKESWNILNQKAFFTLSSLVDSMVIEDKSELYDLKPLAKKLSPEKKETLPQPSQEI